jgi:hypothetical protein
MSPVGYAVHPRDGQPGTVYRTQAGVLLLRVGTAYRSLPADTEIHPLSHSPELEQALDEWLCHAAAAHTDLAFEAALHRFVARVNRLT